MGHKTSWGSDAFTLTLYNLRNNLPAKFFEQFLLIFWYTRLHTFHGNHISRSFRIH